VNEPAPERRARTRAFEGRASAPRLIVGAPAVTLPRVPRDRRWDFLYERRKEPVKDYLLARFADELAKELAAWPPPFVEWVSDELRSRYAIGLEAKPREQVMRFALHVAKLDLGRDFEAIDRLMGEGAQAHWQTAAEAAAGHLLVRFVTEKCLGLKEWAEGARLDRADLVRAVELVERTLFRVTER
jgi:hypothetical protein